MAKIIKSRYVQYASKFKCKRKMKLTFDLIYAKAPTAPVAFANATLASADTTTSITVNAKTTVIATETCAKQKIHHRYIPQQQQIQQQQQHMQQ